MLTLWIGALDQGLAYAGLALGVYLTLRVLNFADITVDGSFALGGGSAALLLSEQVAVPVALLVAVGLGALAGMVTGLIHTRLGVNDLFAGILTTTGLYSITLRLMGRSNIPLTDVQFAASSDIHWLVALLLVVIGLIALLALLLGTDLGLALRAIGNNPVMARSNGISTRRGLTVGIAAGNALVAVHLRHVGTTEVVVSGDRPDLLDALRRRWLPSVVIAHGERTPSPLWTGRNDDRAYVCRGNECLAPSSTPDDLLASLRAALGG